jgi:CHAP domain
MSGQRRSRLSVLAVCACVVLAVLVATLAGTVMAILGGELACLGGGGGTVAAAPATRAAVEEIPPKRLRIYQEAGRRIDIDWTFLASIGTQECGQGACHEVSASGCAGPMQIAYVRGSACSPGSGPTIWERFKVDGDGDGRTSIFDPADAIFTAARILRKVLGAPPAGGTYAAYRQAACGYYGACGDSVANYADEVMARAVEYGFRGKGSPPPEDPKRAEPVQSGGGGGGSSCGDASSAGGATGNEIVRIAESQLGRTESPLGSNCNPYGPCVEWCSLFVAWVWEKAGVPLKGGTAPYAYSGSIYEWAQAHDAGASLPGGSAPGEPPFSGAEPNGARVLPPTATPAPGDAVLFGSGPKASDHIAIVERVFPGGQITTIDGNYSDRVARVGPFLPSQAAEGGEPAPIFGYAQPPGVGGASEGAVR